MIPPIDMGGKISTFAGLENEACGSLCWRITKEIQEQRFQNTAAADPIARNRYQQR
jgi:hypothetical protein